MDTNVTTSPKKAKMVLLYKPDSLMSKLTLFFTGSLCYHCGWLIHETHKLYDMDLTRRRRPWSKYSFSSRISYIIVDTPYAPTEEFLEEKLESDVNNFYGYLDYLLFGFRAVFHFFGESTPNAKGMICSEMMYDDMVAFGLHKSLDEVPAPADLEQLMLGVRNAIKHPSLSKVPGVTIVNKHGL